MPAVRLQPQGVGRRRRSLDYSGNGGRAGYVDAVPGVRVRLPLEAPAPRPALAPAFPVRAPPPPQRLVLLPHAAGGPAPHTLLERNQRRPSTAAGPARGLLGRYVLG